MNNTNTDEAESQKVQSEVENHEDFRYIPLRVHSSYSLLESPVSIEALVGHCIKNQFPAVALTDSSNMFAAFEFSLKAAKMGIQPILGCQFLIYSKEKEESQNAYLKTNVEKETFTLTLLAQTEAGYQNITHLLSNSYIDHEDSSRGISTVVELLNHKEDTVALFSYRNFFTRDNTCISKNQQAKICEQLRELKDSFNCKNTSSLYMEISRYNGDNEQIKSNSDLAEGMILKLAYELNIPLVAVNEAFFLSKEDYESYKVLRCISTGQYINSYKENLINEQNYFLSELEMCNLFEDIPEALANTVNIAKSCFFFLASREIDFPKFQCEICTTESSEIAYQSMLGLCRRFDLNILDEDFITCFKVFSQMYQDYKEVTNLSKNEILKCIPEKIISALGIQYVEQLIYELSIIIAMNFSGYFLIVSDFILWAKNHNIPVGPGRGSGAGSIIAWSLYITELDPIVFGLVFERFLNPERISMPDFDIDFCQSRRDEVIEYVRQKYGSDRVAHIITFGKLQAKAVVRDVGRVLQIPYGKIDNIAGMIPFSAIKAVSLTEAIEKEPKLQEMEKNDSEIALLLSISRKLEGTCRHVSTHAAGIIIGAVPLKNVMPLYREENSHAAISQFSMHYIEPAGLIKFDFLGLKTLTVIQKTIELAGLNIDINKIPLDDKKTYELLQQKLTLGVFQLESTGMSEVLKQFQAENIEAIITLISIYRPGPMENIPKYLEFRHGRAEPDYGYECLKDILRETYSIPVFQEQVMQIARVLAGYSLGEADILRRAMGKKDEKAMAAEQGRFVREANARHGGGEEKAAKLFENIANFAGYAFNKAHAAAYGIISYQTAYLKANYTVEFLTALLMYDKHNTDKLAMIVQECKKLGIYMITPNINLSQDDFSICIGSEEPIIEVDSSTKFIKKDEIKIKSLRTPLRLKSVSPYITNENNNQIVYALSAIKGVGDKTMMSIIEERKKNGIFTSIYDLIERVEPHTLNKRQLENLAAAGAFDSLHGNRRQVYESIVDLLKSSSISKTPTLFSSEEFRIPMKKVKDWSHIEKLSKEFEVFGFYLNEHPIREYEELIKSMKASNTQSITDTLHKVHSVSLLATLESITKRIVHKTRDKYAFLRVSDNHGICELTIFAKQLSEYESILEEGGNYIFTVSGKESDGTMRLICNGVNFLKQNTFRLVKSMTFRLCFQNDIEIFAEFLKQNHKFAEINGSTTQLANAAFHYININIEIHDSVSSNDNCNNENQSQSQTDIFARFRMKKKLATTREIYEQLQEMNCVEVEWE
jgi:DNA polymerase-3 subunit alpha